MKKTLSSVFIFSIFALFTFFGTISVNAATYKLSLSSFFPSSHFMNSVLIKKWVEDIEKVTRGEVQVTVYAGGTLLGARETYDGIVSGTADIGVGVFAYNRGRFPVMEGFELPGIYFGSCTATNLTAWDGYNHFKPKELSDTQLMFFYAVGPGSLYSKNKISSLSDLKGMRIRATGLTAKSIEALGAVPVAMPMPEVYESLSKGVMEGTIAPPEVLKGWKQAEVTNYITIMPPVYNGVHYVVMNKEKYNSMPANIRSAMDKVNERYILKAGQVWDSQMKENGIDFGLQKGMKLNRLSKSDNEKAMALMQPLLDDYINRMNDRGLPGKDIVKFVEEKAAKYSKMYPPAF